MMENVIDRKEIKRRSKLTKHYLVKTQHFVLRRLGYNNISSKCDYSMSLSSHIKLMYDKTQRKAIYSTSKTQEIPLGFAKRVLVKPQMVGVLFVINIDPAQSDTPFACVNDMNAFGAQEQEVFFSMHTIFRIGRVKQLDDDPRLVRVELTMTSEKGNRQLIDHIREETFPDKDG